MSPLATYTAVALLAASVAGAGAWQVQSWRYAAKDAQRIEAQAERARNDRKAAQVASEGFENDKAKREIKYRTITREVEKIIDRPVYRDGLRMDGDGLRILNATIRAPGHPGEPGSAMPSP